MNDVVDIVLGAFIISVLVIVSVTTFVAEVALGSPERS